VRITHVLETHVHNDYVTGGLALAKRSAPTTCCRPARTWRSATRPPATGDVLRSGGCSSWPCTPPATPRPTLATRSWSATARVGLFTGGSLLYGAVGRTDLISPLTRRLALEQHASVRRLADGHADAVEVFPTHGFGSHCSSGTAEVHRAGTIADERLRNPALLEDDAEAFADQLIAGYHPYPRYYAHMGPANAAGPDAIDLRTCRRCSTPDELRSTSGTGRGWWTCARGAYADAHLPGTVNVELRNDLPTYLGWVYPYDQPLVLLAPDEADLRRGQVMLGRIGIDEMAGAVGSIEAIADGTELAANPRVMWDTVNEAPSRRRGRAGRPRGVGVGQRPPQRRGAHPLPRRAGRHRRAARRPRLGVLRHGQPRRRRLVAAGQRRP
jgi:hydroxyacylglutathione hydrolase